MKTKPLFLMISSLALAALACSALSGGGIDPGVATPVEGNPPIETAAPSGGSDPEGGSTPEDSSSSGGEPASPLDFLDLDDPAIYAAPSGFNTYANTFGHTFAGISADGSIVTGTVDSHGANQVEPYATTLEFFTHGRAVLGGSEIFTFTQILDVQYVVYSGIGCLPGVPGAQDNPFGVMLDTGGMLTGQADFSAEETVNGLATYAYEITIWLFQESLTGRQKDPHR